MVTLIEPGDWAGIPYAKWWAVAYDGRIKAVFESELDAVRFVNRRYQSAADYSAGSSLTSSFHTRGTGPSIQNDSYASG